MHIPFLAKILPIISGSYRLIKAAFSLIATVVIVSTLLFVGIYFYFARDLPEIKTLEDYRPPVISEVYANDGSKVGEFWTECRIYYPYNRIPKRVIEAFTAAEDARFFEHKGVDVRSILRALIANIRAGSVSQGGSTITQQITRSLLLSRERTITRKVKEAILATRIERRLNKEQIITLYLNQIYLGNRAYGVGAAARNYFEKNLEDLSLAQIAILAGLPSGPNTFSPVNNPERARARQEFVLGRMLDEKLISREDYHRAMAERFTLRVAGIDKDFTNPAAAFFVEHVRRQVKDTYGDDFLYHRGLKIYTTLDMEMQKVAQQAIMRGLEDTDHRRYPWQGALAHVDASHIDEESAQLEREIIHAQRGEIITWPPGQTDSSATVIEFDPDRTYKAIIVDTSTNDVRIRVGSTSGTIPPEGYQWTHQRPTQAFEVGDIVLVRPMADKTDTMGQRAFALTRVPELQAALFSMDPFTGFVKAIVGGYDFALSEFNRATQAQRQPGSSFKPFIYAAALDKGYTFNTTIMDSPVVFQVGTSSFWSPKNYGGGYRGPTPFANCLKFSRNVPTVKITYDIGMHYLDAYLRKMGFTTQIDKYLSMALGANVVMLSEMVPAYAVFVAEGQYHHPITITKIVDNRGAVLEEVTEEKARAPEYPASPKLAETAELSDETKKFIDALGEGELNTSLFEDQRNWIASDKLVLTDWDLKTLYGTSIPQNYVMTPQTAYMMVQLLKGVVQGGTGTRLLALGKPSGGKTGTTNDETDAWFLSIMPELVSGIWVGFDEIRRIGPGATGGNTAAPIMLEYLKQATLDTEGKDFTPPQGFPTGNIATLTGGSAIQGERPPMSFPGEYGGSNLAGEFFERDLETTEESFDGSSSYGSRGYRPPPPSRNEFRSYPDF